MNSNELSQIQAFLRKTFRNEDIEVRARPNKKDSAEVYISDEFVGVLFRDEEDGELSYQFQMAILELDLAS